MLIKHPYRLPLKFNPVPRLRYDIYKLFIRKTTNNSWKNTVFAYFWFKNQKIQNCFWFILNNFLRAFQRRFQNSKIFTASGDIQQNPRKRQKIHEKIQFFVFFLLKTQKSKNILIYHKAFSESFSMPFSEFQNLYCIWRYSTKTPENDKKFMKKYSFLYFFY